MITIVDYKMGNLGSILNMLKKIGVPAKVSSSPDEVATSEKLILPGVGHFDAAMKNLEEMNLRKALETAVLERKVPTLGLCVGLQIMTKKSEEGSRAGLGWFDAEVKKFSADPARGLKVPHMGWNYVQSTKPNSIFDEIEGGQRFYFVHSYHIVAHEPDVTLATTQYGHPFASALMKGSLIGVQFHPEKSHKFGMRLFKNFAERF